MGKFKVVDDNIDFSKSSCKCHLCDEYEKVKIDWDKMEPKTRLQKRMKNAIKKIEEKAQREARKKRNSSST